MSAPIRVLIADDHPVFRDGLKAILNGQHDFIVIGEAANCEEAVAIAREKRPNIAVVDLRMPGKGGPQTIREIKRESPETGIVILTTFDSDQDVYPGLEAGAAAFLLKDSPVDQIFEAIRIVNRGEALLEPRVARRVLGRFQRSPYTNAPPDPLSARELEVLQCIVDGRTTKGIAGELNLQESTVNTYISRILAKLGARDRTEAVVRAARAGIINLQSTS